MKLFDVLSSFFFLGFGTLTTFQSTVAAAPAIVALAIFLMLFQLFLTHIVFRNSTYPNNTATIDNRYYYISVGTESLVV